MIRPQRTPFGKGGHGQRPSLVRLARILEHGPDGLRSQAVGELLRHLLTESPAAITLFTRAGCFRRLNDLVGQLAESGAIEP